MGKLKKALPSSREQAVVLLDRALKNRRLDADGFEPAPSAKRTLSENTVRLVHQLYSSDVCSRSDPSMSGTIWMKNESGEKVRTAKRYMLYSGGESHQLFLDQPPNNKLSLAKFYELRPKNVRCFADTPHRTCMCKYHSNVLYLLESLSKYIAEAANIKSFIDFIVCDSSSIECVTGNCQECGQFEERVISRFKDEDLTKIIKVPEDRLSASSSKLCWKPSKISASK